MDVDANALSWKGFVAAVAEDDIGSGCDCQRGYRDFQIQRPLMRRCFLAATPKPPPHPPQRCPERSLFPPHLPAVITRLGYDNLTHILRDRRSMLHSFSTKLETIMPPHTI